MASAAFQHLESLLRARCLDGTVTRYAAPEPAPPVAPTGHRALDDAMGGGWRRGELSELVGPGSSGRTALLCVTLAAAGARGEDVALIDAGDAFDPETAAEAGVDLARVLWIRGAAGALAAATPAVRAMALRQAVRACDLVVRAGGFGVVALDLADVPARDLRQVPMTTWLRLARANEGRETAVVLVATAPLGRSARGVSARLCASVVRWSGAHERSRRLDGLDVQIDLVSAARLRAAHVRLGARADNADVSLRAEAEAWGLRT